MRLRIGRIACAISLSAMACVVVPTASVQAQTSTQAAGKATKKPAKKAIRQTDGSRPPTRTEAVDRSVIPERHDARHGY